VGSALSAADTAFARTSSVAPCSALTDAAADGGGWLGAVAQEAVSMAAAMRAAVHRIVDACVTVGLRRRTPPPARASLRPRAATAGPVALAFQLHLIAHTGDTWNCACNLLSMIQLVRRPDVAAKKCH